MDLHLCFRLSTSISFRCTDCFVFYLVDTVFCRKVKGFLFAGLISYTAGKITKKRIAWLRVFSFSKLLRISRREGRGDSGWVVMKGIFCLLQYLLPQWLFRTAVALDFSSLLIIFNLWLTFVRLVHQGPCLVWSPACLLSYFRVGRS